MTYTISVLKRSGAHAEDSRAAGNVPGVVYGPDRQPVAVELPYRDLEKLYHGAGESNLVDLTLDGEKEPVKVLVQAVQFDPVSGRMLSVDFRQINMQKEMEASIVLHIIGEAPTVKQLGGTLVVSQDHLNIRCLPKDLVGEVSVDVSVLATFDDAIHVRDIALPAGIVALDNGDNLIVKVTAPMTEEELKAMEETGPVSVEDIQVEEKGKKDEEGGDDKEGGKTEKEKEKEKK